MTEAANLLAADMWFSGAFPEITPPEAFRGDYRDPRLAQLLRGHAAYLLNSLQESVSSGEARAFVRRNFSNELDTDLTFICGADLIKWSQVRGFEPGDVLGEWMFKEGELASYMLEEAATARAISSNGAEQNPGANPGVIGVRELDGTESEREVIRAHRNLVVEIGRLRRRNDELEQAVRKLDAPLNSRAKGTLLCLINALAAFAKIDLNARGASKKLMDISQSAGTPIDDQTINSYLRELPEAVERRTK